MKQLAWVTGCACVLSLAGCSQSAMPDGGGDSGPGADVRVSETAVDASDAGTIDAQTDAPVGPDIVDSGTPIDVPGDSGPTSLAGRWRLVRYDVPGDAGVTMLTDMNTSFPSPGGPVDARVNGILTLAPNRLSLSFGFLVNDHFIVDQAMSDPSNAFGAYGIGAPGTLSTSSFMIPTQPSIVFTQNGDGTISQANADGNTFRWMRAPSVPDVATVMRQGFQFRLAPAMSAAFSAPRAALAWDRSGPGGYLFTDDAAIAFLPSGVAAFNINVTAAPPSAVITTDGTQYAIAYVVVYDDRDGSGTFTLGASADSGSGDVVRGVSPVAIAWRSTGAPSAAFGSGSFQDLGPGFQLVHMHPDFSVGANVGVTPFDNTNLVNPDGMITIGAAPMGIPNLVP